LVENVLILKGSAKFLKGDIYLFTNFGVLF